MKELRTTNYAKTSRAASGAAKPVRWLVLPLLFALACATLARPALPAQADTKGLPPGFDTQIVASGVDLPVALAWLPDGRMLLAEKGGMLKLIDNNLIYARPVIDLRDEVDDFVDRGLLGLAVDPNFTANGFVYLMYAYDAPGQAKDVDEPRMGRLVRYVMRHDVIDKNSGVILLDDYESTAQNHSIGDLKWAPDGSLYVSLGEGSLSALAQQIAFRAQDLNSTNGKILRIDPLTGDGLPGNPFYDAASPHSAKSRVWSLGHRNPYRISVNPVTGIPWSGNVGWWTYESLQIARAGDNFGWPCTEGPIATNDYPKLGDCTNVKPWTVAPSFDYPHKLGNASLTAGDFNIYANFPAEMQGDYFYGDYSLQWIRRMKVDLAKDKILSDEPFASGQGEPAEIEFSPDGELFYLPLYSGVVRKIVYTDGYKREWKPALEAICKSACNTVDGGVSGGAPFTVTFSAAGTTNPNNENLSHAMTFGDEGDRHPPRLNLPASFANTFTFTHVYTQPGVYVARLFTRAENGAVHITERRVTVGKPTPVVRVVSPGALSEFVPGQRVELAAQATDAFNNAGGITTRWWVDVLDGLKSKVLVNEDKPSTSFIVPADLSRDAKLNVWVYAQAADGAVTAKRIPLVRKAADGYVRTWYLTRAFQFTGDERPIEPDTLGDAGGEAKFAVTDETVHAQLIYNDSFLINFKDYNTPNYRTLAYAFIWINSPDDRKGLLGINSDDGNAVWLNGQQIWKNNVSRSVPKPGEKDDLRDIDLPAIQLRKGKNALLVKVSQNDGDWVFKLRVLNSDGSIMQDVTAESR